MYHLLKPACTPFWLKLAAPLTSPPVSFSTPTLPKQMERIPGENDDNHLIFYPVIDIESHSKKLG